MPHVILVAAVAFSPLTHAAQSRPPLSGTVVVVNQQSDSATLVDLKTMTAYRNVAVVGGPHEAVASPDGRRVVVTNYNKAGVGRRRY